MNSPLAKLIPKQMDVEGIKRDAWQEHRILVIHPDHPELDWTEKQEIINIGNRIYGKQRSGR